MRETARPSKGLVQDDHYSITFSDAIFTPWILPFAIDAHQRQGHIIVGSGVPMADIVNLRRHRKRIAREQAEQTAAVRRLEFGRTKAQRAAEAASERRKETSLDGHRRVREGET